MTALSGKMLSYQSLLLEPQLCSSKLYFSLYNSHHLFSDVAKGPAGHAEQDHNIAKMSFCKILKNSIHIISMKIKNIGSIHPLTIHSFQFHEVLLTSPVLLRRRVCLS